MSLGRLSAWAARSSGCDHANHNDLATRWPVTRRGSRRRTRRIGGAAAPNLHDNKHTAAINDQSICTGSTGDSFDNALAENLWSTIKVELVYWPGTTFATRAEAEHALVRYIDGWYNPRRIQAGLDGLSPDEYEDAHHRAQRGAHR